MIANLSTPIVLIIFKRPEQTARVFQSISEIKPCRLYIIADGPRNADEAFLCQQTRKVVEKIDWDCEVIKNYAETNLGLRKRIVSGLDWVFEREERIIVLEDDCVPHPTFFRFCEELLEYYNEDARVMHISGDNFLQGRRIPSESYYFSKYAHVWGWATWRRAWLLFHKWDDEFLNLKLDYLIFQTQVERNFWKTLLDELRFRRMDYTWDYQWALICMANRALCIMPKSNLVANIGFGVNATHTHIDEWFANLPVVSIEFPLVHPHQMSWDFDADQMTASIFFSSTPESKFGFIRNFFQRLMKIFEN